MRICPMCAEDVDADVAACPHCDTNFGVAAPPSIAPKRPVRLWRKVLIGGGVAWVTIAVATVGISLLMDAHDARVKTDELKTKQAQQAKYLAEGRQLAAEQYWSGANTALSRAFSLGPLDANDDALRTLVITHVALEAMCASDIEEVAREVVNVLMPMAKEGLNSNELRLLHIFESSTARAMVKAAWAERDALDARRDNLEGSAEATVCQNASSLTSSFDFDPTKLSAMDRAALQRCGTITSDIEASRRRALEGQRKLDAAAIALQAELRYACAGQDPPAAPTPAPPPTESVVLDANDVEVIEEGDVEGVVLAVQEGDYVHLDLRTASAEKISFIVAADLGSNPSALVGKAVRVHYAKQRMTIPEAGVASTELMLRELKVMSPSSAALIDDGGNGAVQSATVPQPLSEQTWHDDPRIVAVRDIVNTVNAALPQWESKSRLTPCAGVPVANTLVVDVSGRARRYFARWDQGGSSYTLTATYDELGSLRFVSSRGASTDGSSIEQRFWFDETGARLWHNETTKGGGSSLWRYDPSSNSLADARSALGACFDGVRGAEDAP